MSTGSKIEFKTPWLHDALSAGGRPMALTELGNSERLVIAHGDDLRYFHDLRRWYVWDGTRFASDGNGEVRRRAKKTVKGILFEAATQDDEQLRTQITAHQIRSESDRAVRAMMALAESHERVAGRSSDFDQDPLLFNVANGTIDLRTGSLLEHNRAHLLTKLAPIVLNADAQAPTWERFLCEVMGNDAEKISFLRRAVGYSLTGEISENVFFLLHGTGANGKSTFLEVLRFALGDYATQSDFSTFLASKTGGAIRNDIARLKGARLVTAAESDAGRRLSENIVKHLTGGDTVTARYLYAEHFEFVPAFKLWLATNNRPRIFGTDEAIWRRVRLVPFTVTIPAESRDPRLAAKLKSELSGILNWALEGLAEWRQHGLGVPAAIAQARMDYRRHEDALGRFIDDCIEADQTSQVSASDLYRAYKELCERTGEFHLRDRDFSDVMEGRGFVKHRTNKGNFWKSIRLDG